MILIKPLLKTVIHAMSNVDQSSGLLLNMNAYLVNFALDHDIPQIAHMSLQSVQMFDHIGTCIIAFALFLSSLIKSS